MLGDRELRLPQGLRVRAGWGLADQALSSITNVVLVVLVARAVTPHGFGAFALALVVYQIILVAARGTVGEPMLIRHSSRTPGALRDIAGQATSVAMVLGLATGSLVAALAVTMRAESRAVLLALALGAPGLLVQDTWRYTFVAAKQSNKAFVNDLIWTVTGLTFVAYLVLQGQPAAWQLTLAWGLSASVAAAAGFIQMKLRPRFARPGAWATDNRALIPALLMESVTVAGATHLTALVVAGTAGLAVLGALKAAQVLLGPVTAVVVGLGLIATPEIVRLRQRAPESLNRAVHLLGLLLATFALMWGVAVPLAPDSIGRILLADVWPAAEPVVALLAIAVAAEAVTTVFSLGLRAAGVPARSLRARAIAAPVLVAAAAIGAIVAGARGAAIGIAVGMLASAYLTRREFTDVASRVLSSGSAQPHRPD